MNTHQIIDGNGKSIVQGIGADLFARADLLSKPGYKLVALTPTDAAPVAAPFPGSTFGVQTPPPAKVTGQVTDMAAKARIDADRAAVVACGLKAPEVWFTPGTDMMDCGEQTYFGLKKGYDDLRSFRESAMEGVRFIESLNRTDHVVAFDGANVPTVDGNGNLHVNGHEIRMTAEGLTALLAWFPEVFPSGKSWALQMGPKALGASITDGFERYAAMVARTNGKGKRVQLRVQGPADNRALWTVVGPKYPGRATDADAILKRMVAMVDGTPDGGKARGSVTIDPNTSRLNAEVVWWNQHIGANPKVGDVFRAFVRATSRDDGKGAYSGSGGIEAIRCINCSLAESVMEVIRGIHRSEAGVMAAVDATAKAVDMVSPLIQRFAVVAEVDCALNVEQDGATVTLENPADIYGVICADGELLGDVLKDAGIARDAMVEMLLTAHKGEQAEGRMDGSLADIVRATAKAAQDRKLDVFQRAAIEAGSGRLLRILSDGTIEEPQA
jgi:hypothetical protein